jgi:two-component system sensor histidine kinase/response regulator
MSDIISYLRKSVHKSESLKDLLMICMDASASAGGALFVYNKQYKCLEHIHIHNFDIDEIKLMTAGKLSGVHIDNTGSAEGTYRTRHGALKKVPSIVGLDAGIRARYLISTLLLIPITLDLEHVGVLCLIDREGGYEEEIIELLTPYLSLVQIALSKRQLYNEYKDVCSESAYASKDLFLANMSHEIRTPLNGVIGYNQLMMQTSLTSTQKAYLTSMNHCSLQLMHIINDILDFSKLGSGKVTMHIECVAVTEVARMINDALGQRMSEKKQHYSFTTDYTVPEFIVLDKQKLVQVLINLVSNASKFTDVSGSISVRVRVASDMLRVEVIDSGVGISEADQCKLFNSFMQVNTSVCTGGTGLGLAISKKLTEVLGGEIGVRSLPGSGSTFWITAAFNPYEDYEKSMEQDMKVLKNKVVLVVDDNMDNRLWLSEMLYAMDMKPVVCASATEGLRTVMSGREKIDLCLIDICMPGVTGTELAQQLKEERPFLPLIALSSLATFVGTPDFEGRLDKPILKVQLASMMSQVLARKRNPSSYIGDSESSSDSSSHGDEFKRDSRILIAEDISYNRALLGSILKSLKYTDISEVENGQEACQMMETAQKEGTPFDILLLDLRMPVMDGHEVITVMTEMGWKRPQIIVVTASVMDEDRAQCRENGIKYFLSKPIDIKELRDVMLHACKR